jgi:phage baseplate assembly protein gpV
MALSSETKLQLSAALKNPTAYNAIVAILEGSLTTDTLVFDAATGGNEIRITNNVADALSIECTGGDLMVFTTTASANRVTITPATTITGALTLNGGAVVSTGGVNMTGATGVNEIIVTNNANDGLSIKAAGSADLIAFNTTATPSITVTPATTITGALTLNGGAVVSTGGVNMTGATGVNEIIVTNNANDGLSIKAAGSADLIAFNTTATPSITVTPATTITGALTVNGGATLADNKNVAVGTSAGTIIATNNTQKIGFYGATPVVQQATIANATNNADNLMAQLNSVISTLKTFGLIASS